MSNHVLSSKQVKDVERIEEIQAHVKLLNAEKAQLQSGLFTGVGFDERPPLGTTTFIDEDGSERIKIAVGSEIKPDNSALFDKLKSLQKAGLLHTVVKPDFKIDKRTFDGLPDNLKSMIADSVTVSNKKPTLTIL